VLATAQLPGAGGFGYYPAMPSGKHRRAFAIGVDIGGRSAKIALVRDDGIIVQRDQRPLDGTMSLSAVVGLLADGIRGMIEAAKKHRAKPLGAGVVMPGYLDETLQRVQLVANMPNLTGTPFPHRLARAVPLPVQFDVDANAAALGEYHFGAGRGVRRLLVATLGTGIGGGVILDGKVLRVRNHVAGSLGHVIVNPDGLRCQCGARGCLEMYASARGFERVANETADRHPHGRLARLRRKRGQLSGPELAEAIRAGDAAARAVVDRCCRWLAAGIETWCVIYMPERVLLGGGVAAIGRPLLRSVRESFRDIAQPYVLERTTIDLAALGNDAGMIGAASLWFR